MNPGLSKSKGPVLEPCPEPVLQVEYYFLRITLPSLPVFMVDRESCSFLKHSLSWKLPPLSHQVFCPDAEAEIVFNVQDPSLPLFPSPHPPAQPPGGQELDPCSQALLSPVRRWFARPGLLGAGATQMLGWQDPPRRQELSQIHRVTYDLSSLPVGDTLKKPRHFL